MSKEWSNDSEFSEIWKDLRFDYEKTVADVNIIFQWGGNLQTIQSLKSINNPYICALCKVNKLDMGNVNLAVMRFSEEEKAKFQDYVKVLQLVQNHIDGKGINDVKFIKKIHELYVKDKDTDSVEQNDGEDSDTNTTDNEQPPTKKQKTATVSTEEESDEIKVKYEKQNKEKPEESVVTVTEDKQKHKQAIKDLGIQALLHIHTTGLNSKTNKNDIQYIKSILNDDGIEETDEEIKAKLNKILNTEPVEAEPEDEQAEYKETQITVSTEDIGDLTFSAPKAALNESSKLAELFTLREQYYVNSIATASVNDDVSKLEEIEREVEEYTEVLVAHSLQMQMVFEKCMDEVRSLKGRLLQKSGP